MKKKKSLNPIGYDYEIGYKKPPVHSRFKKGVSGNPLGRKKKSASMNEMIELELNKKISISENGRTKLITKKEAFIRQTINLAIKGDGKMIKLLLGMLENQGSSIKEEDYIDFSSYLGEVG